MKRFSAWIVIFVVVLSVIAAPAYASNCTEDIIDLGDGFCMSKVGRLSITGSPDGTLS